MAVALVCGLLIALFYDIYWLLSASQPANRGLRALQDMLFWVAAFCLVAALWLYCTGGIMRLSVYLWLGLGFFLFRLLLSPPLRSLRPVRKLPRKSYSIPPGLQHVAALPGAVMFMLGSFMWRIKPALFVKSATKTLKQPKLVAQCQSRLKSLRGAILKFFGYFFSKK